MWAECGAYLFGSNLLDAFSRGTVGVRQLTSQDPLKFRQQPVAVNPTPSQRGVERPEHPLGPVDAQSLALQALDDFALSCDALDTLLNAFFGERKLALDGGAIHSSAPSEGGGSVISFVARLTEPRSPGCGNLKARLWQRKVARQAVLVRRATAAVQGHDGAAAPLFACPAATSRSAQQRKFEFLLQLVAVRYVRLERRLNDLQHLLGMIGVLLT